jgi:hypothetical protein
MVCLLTCAFTVGVILLVFWVFGCSMLYRYFRVSNTYTYIFMLGLHERMDYFAVYTACFWSLGVSQYLLLDYCPHQ